MSEEEKQLLQLEKDFDAALSQYQQYARMAGVSGMDITFEVADIALKVEVLKEELLDFKEQLMDEHLVQKVEILSERMDKFLDYMR